MVSAENVEKVVRAPRNPVVTSRRAAGEMLSGPARAIITPMMNAPMRFAANVPSGKVGKLGLNSTPSPQRAHAPRMAPIAITSKLVQGIRDSFFARS